MWPRRWVRAFCQVPSIWGCSSHFQKSVDRSSLLPACFAWPRQTKVIVRVSWTSEKENLCTNLLPKDVSNLVHAYGIPQGESCLKFKREHRGENKQRWLSPACLPACLPPAVLCCDGLSNSLCVQTSQGAKSQQQLKHLFI
jgi:hypothetical protein